MSKAVLLGIDVGNFDAKSEHTTIPSGLKEFSSRPSMTASWLRVGNKYYTTSTDRVQYVRDKTVDDRHFILTVYSMASELYYQLEKHDSVPAEGTRLIYDNVKVAVGVPPAHHQRLATKYKEYFLKRFGTSLEIEYNGIVMVLNVTSVSVLPQDYIVVKEYANRTKYARFDDSGKHPLYAQYFAVDIGGETVDYVIVENGYPQKFDSLQDGILEMFSSILHGLNINYGVDFNNTILENVLLGNQTTVREEYRKFILEEAQKWTNQMIEKLHGNLSFEAAPVIFVGGGSKLLRRYIKNNKMLGEFEFFGGSNINAQAYTRYLKGVELKNNVSTARL